MIDSRMFVVHHILQDVNLLFEIHLHRLQLPLTLFDFSLLVLFAEWLTTAECTGHVLTLSFSRVR